MNVVDSKENEGIHDSEFDPEFTRFIKSLQQNCKDYDTLVDILNTIM